jgi:imidazolonepropionase
MPRRHSPTPSASPVLLLNIRQLLTLRNALGNPTPRRGIELRNLTTIEGGAVLCIGGKITSVGTTSVALRDPWIKKHRKKLHEIDCAGKVVLPGFVDSHTHPAFIAPRLTDFEKRISGASYEQIAAAGGGIRSSINAVRKARKISLIERVGRALNEMASQGTTTVEAKSGYGLSLDSELKSLEAIKAASAQWPGSIVPTLLGAHVVPPEYQSNSDRYVDLICDQMIPRVAKRSLARFVDVFCDRGAFSEEDSIRILVAARKHGFEVRAHISQLTRTPLERVLAVGPLSLDHLDHATDADISLLSRSNTIATLVPGANYFLGLHEYPPARNLIDAGAAVALATDYNPGSSPTPSMLFVLSLACTHMQMTPAEAIAAATINGAYALGLQKSKGSIEPGKDADMAIFNVSDYRELAYWVASSRCEAVIANGVLSGSPSLISNMK